MRKIEVSEETYEKIKEQLGDEITDINSYDEMVGKKFFFRQVTYHSVGKVVKRIGDHLQLSDASWIPDSGRFMKAIKEGILDEIEPVGTMFINIKANVDFFPWLHKLPKEQK